MTTFRISSTDLRTKAADILKALRTGDNFIIMHYKEPVGFITPEVPKKLLSEVGVKSRKGFRRVE